VPLKEVDGSPGPPWDLRREGRLDELTVESDVLKDNPLGDPHRRPLYVYLPDGMNAGGSYPSIYLIQGFTGQVDMWKNRTFGEPNMIERLDELFADPAVPRAVIVMVDAWTSYGGSQFINSTSTGRYMDYLCDEVTAFVDDRYPTIADAAHRGLTGKSSGGYGAMVVPMKRSDVFNALASHAGDANFEACYLPEFRETARTLRDRFEGSIEVFLERMKEADRFDFDEFAPFEDYGYAACYSPDPDNPGKALLPYDIETGALIPEIWDRWLEWDPVRLVSRHVADLQKMKLIYLDSGSSDEYFLDLGATAMSKELTKHGIEHRLEFFEGKHGGIQFRYPIAIRALAEALTP
jgi:S-formylglutathione hydrolase FrmB